jgi:hypothetical protein
MCAGDIFFWFFCGAKKANAENSRAPPTPERTVARSLIIIGNSQCGMLRTSGQVEAI